MNLPDVSNNQNLNDFKQYLELQFFREPEVIENIDKIVIAIHYDMKVFNIEIPKNKVSSLITDLYLWKSFEFHKIGEKQHEKRKN